MKRSVCRVMAGVAVLAVLGMTAAPAGALAESMLVPDAGCALPLEPGD